MCRVYSELGDYDSPQLPIRCNSLKCISFYYFFPLLVPPFIYISFLVGYWLLPLCSACLQQITWRSYSPCLLSSLCSRIFDFLFLILSVSVHNYISVGLSLSNLWKYCLAFTAIYSRTDITEQFELLYMINLAQ